MADPVVVRVELSDAAEFAEDYEVDPDRPLVELVRRLAKEHNIPLVTRQGRPLAWEAEGPDWRPGKEGRTDLTRTQALSKIVAHVREGGGQGSPLFMISLSIPGAAEAINAARDEAKRAEIDERLAQREAERLAQREAERLAEQEALGGPPAGADRMAFEDEDDIATIAHDVEAPGIEDAPTEIGRPPKPRGVENLGEERSVESRIRRAGTAAAVGVGVAAVGVGAAASRGAGRARGGGGRAGSRKRKKAQAATGPGGLPATIGGLPTTWVLGGGAAASLLMVGLVVVVVVAAGREPEPTPEPTPEVVADVVVDIPIASTPAPTPPPRETPPPRKFSTFYSSSKVDRNNAASVGAQISSFAKGEVKLGYRVSGAHTLRLKGRFDLYIGESASTLEGASSKTCKGAPAGADTKVSVHWEGDTVTARIGNSRCGPVAVKGTSGFPGWKFEPGATATLTKLWASAPDEE